MRELAVFASSEQGRLYAMTCERFGVDPGAIFTDDVMAINARIVFAKMLSETREPEPEPQMLRLATRG